MKIKRKVLTRDIWQVIGQNKIRLLGVASLIQVLLTTLGGWLLTRGLGLILVLSRQENIDTSNLVSIVLNPLGLVGIVAFLMLFALLMYVEFSLLIGLIESVKYRIQFKPVRIIRQSFAKVRRMFGMQLVYFVGYLLVTLPVSGIVLGSVLTERIYIPSFITGEFMKTPTGMVGVAIGMLVLTYLNLRLIYVTPLMMTARRKFSDNIKLSWQLTRQNRWALFGSLVFFGVGMLFLLVLVMIVSIIVLYLLERQGVSGWVAPAVVLTGIKLVLFSFTLYMKLILLIALLRVIELHQLIEQPMDAVPRIANRKRSLGLLMFMSVAIITMFASNALDLVDNEFNQDLLVVAHRGYVSEGVENSIEALEAAARQGADYVELDILMTKDHRFVVMHDYNLKRLAGIDRRVQDMTYDEVVGLPIDQNGFHSHIPSFDEFVAKAKALNMKLVVELKPHGGEPDNYVDLFIAKMRELEVDTTYKVMSLKLNVMEAINQKAPEMDTGYVIPLQFGKFASNNVDFFVIEDFSYNDELVEDAAARGKEVFVWTINEEEKINQYIERPLTGIITDYPDLVNVAREAHLTEQVNAETGADPFRFLNKVFRLISVGNGA